MALAVLVHGLHVDSKDWDHLVWGRPLEGLLGRAAQGIVEAVRQNADLIVWGTGASERGGLKESQYTFNLARMRADQLTRITQKYWRTSSLVRYLDRVSVVDTTTQNTAQEAEAAVRLCMERGIDSLMLVSTPSHVPRCFRDAQAAKKRLRASKLRIYATAADTYYPDEEMNDVVILEVPHRPDRAAPSFAAIAKRLFPFYRDQSAADALAGDLTRVIEEHESRLSV